MSEQKMEIYNVDKTYLEGWYTLDDLKRVLETAERIDEVNRMLAEQAKPEGFQTMDETAKVPDETWNKT